MRRPLEHLTVLDLSRVLSGPFGTQQLADLGARVIKIEHPSGGDDTRRFGPPFVAGESTYFMSVNRGKKSVAIDLKTPRGRDLVLALADHVDVVVENFRPGVAERLGLSPHDLRRRAPRLITCSISGFGASGDRRFADRPGYDIVIQAVTGFMALTGPAEGAPHRAGVAIGDLVAGLYAAQGILAALVDRERTGTGQHLDVSMQEALLSLLTYQAGRYFATGQSPTRMGNAHPSICPYEAVETLDGPLILAVGTDAQFAALADVLGLPWLKADPRFRTNPARVESREALMTILANRLQERPRSEWERLLEEAGVPCGPVLSVADALGHPQVLARNTILRHDHPRAGTVRTLRSPVRLEDSPTTGFSEDQGAPEGLGPPPVLGQHTDEVLMAMLGLSTEDLASLEADSVIGRSRASS